MTLRRTTRTRRLSPQKAARYREVREQVAEVETVTLTLRDWEAFLAALDDADRPRPRLATAVRRCQSRREHDAG